jgi:hypothetical protein
MGNAGPMVILPGEHSGIDYLRRAVDSLRLETGGRIRVNLIAVEAILVESAHSQAGYNPGETTVRSFFQRVGGSRLPWRKD